MVGGRSEVEYITLTFTGVDVIEAMGGGAYRDEYPSSNETVALSGYTPASVAGMEWCS
jgi:hypothetical protein